MFTRNGENSTDGPGGEDLEELSESEGEKGGDQREILREQQRRRRCLTAPQRRRIRHRDHLVHFLKF